MLPLTTSKNAAQRHTLLFKANLPSIAPAVIMSRKYIEMQVAHGLQRCQPHQG